MVFKLYKNDCSWELLASNFKIHFEKFQPIVVQYIEIVETAANESMIENKQENF